MYNEERFAVTCRPTFSNHKVIKSRAEPYSRVVYGVGLRLFACWGCGFESRGGKDISRERCVLSGRGLCNGPITRPEESYRVCVCVSVCVFVSVMSKPQQCGGPGPLWALRQEEKLNRAGRG